MYWVKNIKKTRFRDYPPVIIDKIQTSIEQQDLDIKKISGEYSGFSDWDNIPFNKILTPEYLNILAEEGRLQPDYAAEIKNFKSYAATYSENGDIRVDVSYDIGNTYYSSYIYIAEKKEDVLYVFGEATVLVTRMHTPTRKVNINNTDFTRSYMGMKFVSSKGNIAIKTIADGPSYTRLTGIHKAFFDFLEQNGKWKK